jgi:hypothetical protein
MFGKSLSGSKMEIMTDLMKMDCEYGEWKKKHRVVSKNDSFLSNLFHVSPQSSYHTSFAGIFLQ